MAIARAVGAAAWTVAGYYAASAIVRFSFRIRNIRSQQYSIVGDEWWSHHIYAASAGVVGAAVFCFFALRWWRRGAPEDFEGARTAVVGIAAVVFVAALPVLEWGLLQARYLSLLESGTDRNAAAALVTLRSGRAPESLIAAIKKGDQYAYAAAEALLRLPNGREQIKSIARDTSAPPHARFTAALAWYLEPQQRGGTSPPEAIGVIEAMLQDADPDTRMKAIDRLREPFDHDIFDLWVTPLVIDPSPLVRRRLVESLKYEEGWPVCAELTLLFDDDDDDVRVQAFERYQKCAPLESLNTPTEEQRQRAEQDLRDITALLPRIQRDAAFRLADNGHPIGIEWVKQYIRARVQTRHDEDRMIMHGLTVLAQGANEAVAPMLWTIGHCQARRPAVRARALGELYDIYIRRDGPTGRPPAEYRLNSATPAAFVSEYCADK